MSWQEKVREAFGFLELVEAGDEPPAKPEVAGKPKSTARDGRIRQAINLLIDAMGGMDEDETDDPIQRLAADAEAKARIKSALMAAKESLEEALEAEDLDEHGSASDPGYAKFHGKAGGVSSSRPSGGAASANAKDFKVEGTSDMRDLAKAAGISKGAPVIVKNSGMGSRGNDVVSGRVGSITKNAIVIRNDRLGDFVISRTRDTKASIALDSSRAKLGESESWDELDEADGESGVVMLEEKALRPDGTLKLKLISPGWGSKGYYSPDVLKRDGPKAWPTGTHMYWNHPTEAEEALRPERDLRDLAAVTVTDPVFMENGPSGPGLYADAKVFGDYQKPVEDMAPHIGVSIRAAGMAKFGEAEGKSGNIVEAITQGRSVDFVTKAGRGGEILQLFESARGGNFGRPVYSAGTSSQPGGQEDQMTQQELEEARRERDEARAENAKLVGQVVGAEAARYARELLAPVPLMEAAKDRLITSTSINPPIKDGKLDRDAFKASLAEAAKAEAAYVAQLTGQTGEVRGLGLSEADADPFGGITGGAPAAPKALAEATAETQALFQSLGMSEAAAKAAAAGRN